MKNFNNVGGVTEATYSYLKCETLSLFDSSREITQINVFLLWITSYIEV